LGAGRDGLSSRRRRELATGGVRADRVGVELPPRAIAREAPRAMRPRPLARDTSAGPLRKEGGHPEDTLVTDRPVLTWEVGAHAPTAGGPLPRSCEPTALSASRATVETVERPSMSRDMKAAWVTRSRRLTERVGYGDQAIERLCSRVDKIAEVDERRWPGRPLPIYGWRRTRAGLAPP
jgi:hypothetical protein